MDVTSLNLPIVIQQAGDVSRVADAAHRHPQVQQTAAQLEEARRQEMERSSVHRPERTDADNRVLVGDQGGGGGAEHHAQPRRHRPGDELAETELAQDEGGALVDVVV